MARPSSTDYVAALGDRDPYHLPSETYKRGKQEDGSYRDWGGYLDFGFHGGKRVRKEFSGPKERDVLDRIRRFRNELKAAKQKAKSDPGETLETYLKWWMKNIYVHDVKPVTYQNRVYQVEKHLIPALGKVPLHELTQTQIQGYFNQNPKSLAPSYLEQIRNVLRLALEYAMDRDENPIPKNPCRKIKLPVKEERGKALSDAEIVRLIRALEIHYHRALFATVLVMGFRRSEILRLRWEDVFFDRGMIAVREAKVRRGKPEKITLLPLPPNLAAILREHRERQTKRHGEQPLVFVGHRGRPLGKNSIFVQFKRLLADAGLPNIRLHDLRHTLSTEVQKRGGSTKAVQGLLRHKNVQTTLGVYTHVDMELIAQATEISDAFLGLLSAPEIEVSDADMGYNRSGTEG